MKTRIYWFSGTGNSLTLARDLAARLEAVELVPMAGHCADETATAECIGLVCPVYAFGVPGLVAEFVRTLPLAGVSYVFSVVTYAGLAGAPHHELARILRQRGQTLAAGWSMKMPENYTVMSGAPSQAHQQARFAAAESRLAGVAAAIREQRRVRLEDTRIPARWVSAIHSSAIKHFRTLDTRFSVDPQCTHCGVCARVCPVGNIRMEQGLPTWLHHCEQCFGCLQWCPVAAIQMGSVTRGRARYHHPHVRWQDVAPHRP